MNSVWGAVQNQERRALQQWEGGERKLGGGREKGKLHAGWWGEVGGRIPTRAVECWHAPHLASLSSDREEGWST